MHSGRQIFFFLLVLVLPALLSLRSFYSKSKTLQQFHLKEFEKSLVLIPKGSFTTGGEILYPGAEKTPVQVTAVDSFYMAIHEVTNSDYLAFVNELKQTDTALYHTLLPDTLVWQSTLHYQQPYTGDYFRHPAYEAYPVVGITHEQASRYCIWLTEKYAREPGRKFSKAKFSLPSLSQWNFAAHSVSGDFPWEGGSLQNKQGKWMANFTLVAQKGMIRQTCTVIDKNGKSVCKEFLVSDGMTEHVGSSGVHLSENTIPVMSFYPNKYGLYDLAGNVAEYIREPGKTKGGSWKDTGYYLQNSVEQTYDASHAVSSDRGFRFVMEIGK